MSNNISSYYPAGQRILRKKGLENNYENFMQEFGSRINDEDRAIINSNDSERINRLITNKSRPRAIKKTRLHIFKTLLAGCVLSIIGVPTYLYVQNGIEDVDVNLLIIFIPFVVIVFIISYYKTIHLTEIVDDFSIPMEACNLNINQ